MMTNLDRLIAELTKKLELFESLYDFVVLSEKNNININEKIAFLGEYRNLLVEGIILNICHILIDKHENEKSLMRAELDLIEEKLTEDDTKVLLEELQAMRNCKEYGSTIGLIKTFRNNHVAHRGNIDLTDLGLTAYQLKKVAKNIIRCYEIARLVTHGVKMSFQSSWANHNHSNIIEALLLQNEIRSVKDEYHKNIWTLTDKWYSSTLDFWQERILPQLIIDKSKGACCNDQS